MNTIIAIAPTNRKRLRSASDAEEPNVALSCVVSAERREAMSPVFSRVEEARIEPGQMGEEIGAKVGDHPLAERHHQIVSRAGRQREHGDDADHGQKISSDEAGVGVREAEVDHAPNRDRHDERRSRKRW